MNKRIPHTSRRRRIEWDIFSLFFLRMSFSQRCWNFFFLFSKVNWKTFLCFDFKTMQSAKWCAFDLICLAHTRWSLARRELHNRWAHKFTEKACKSLLQSQNHRWWCNFFWFFTRIILTPFQVAHFYHNVLSVANNVIPTTLNETICWTWSNFSLWRVILFARNMLISLDSFAYVSLFSLAC